MATKIEVGKERDGMIALVMFPQGDGLHGLNVGVHLSAACALKLIGDIQRVLDDLSAKAGVPLGSKAVL